MSSQSYSNLQERVEQAAEAALKRNGSVGPLELFQEMRWLQPAATYGAANAPKHIKGRGVLRT